MMLVFRNILEKVYNGDEVTTRGQKVKEIINASYTLYPRERFMCFTHRKINMDYIKQEFLWYLVGNKFDKSIVSLAKIWGDMVNSDGSINSNYGQYIFDPLSGNGFQSNFTRVTNLLRHDPTTRRAAITILSNWHLSSETKDYPCTVYINFLIRDNKLHIFVRMRSQDAIFGMTNDAPFFSFLHELLWARLSEYLPDLELGKYYHSADSLHIYERHFAMVGKILADPSVSNNEHADCPRMTTKTYPELLLLRQRLLSGTAPDLSEYSDPWVHWLLARNDPTTVLMPKVD